jgi:PhnB protein
MAGTVNYKPEGYPTLTPYLTVRGGLAAIEFYKQAFGAEQRGDVMLAPDGTSVGHAELTIGDSLIMLSDESPMMGNKSPLALGGTPVSLAVYVENVDAVFARALAAGATAVAPVENRFYGDRAGMVEDPFGHCWSLMTHVEDVSPEEMMRRMDEMHAQMAGAAQ